MIVVIADDLSGAAELAGAARRQGLSAEVQTEFSPATDAEVVCVDTDSRLLSPAEAASRVAAVARRVVAAQPAWLFKKCDSVLRGPVLAEAHAVREAAGKQRILLVPANPSRQRTISSGIYRIAGQPLNETLFAADPTHPRRTADINVLLDGDFAGVAVPDVTTDNDVRSQAERLDEQTLPVGAVDFFSALLALRVPRRSIPESKQAVSGKTLLVCGSEASWPQRSSQAQARGIPTFALPYDIPAAAHALGANQAVLVGIGDATRAPHVSSAELARQLAQTVAAILGQTSVETLLLEGGATSAAVIAALGWTRLRVEQAADPGVGVLRPIAEQAPLVVIKPGSYSWPAAFWP